MEDYKKILQERLKETLSNDTQEAVAKKLNTVQSNVSKWIKGTQTPTPDTLVEISRAYKVSIDWLLGISDVKDIDGLALKKLTYKDVMELLDMFFENNNIEVADVGPFLQAAEEMNKEEHDSIAEIDEDASYDEQATLLDLHQYEPEYLKVKDRLLAFFLRRRYMSKKVGDDVYEVWRDKFVPQNKELNIARDNEPIQKIAERLKDVSTYKDAEWIAFMEKVSKYNDNEYEQLIELLEKDGTIR